MPPVRISSVRPERCHLRDQVVVPFGIRNKHNPKMRPNRKRAFKHLQNHVGGRARRHVVVRRLSPQQQIPHASPCEVSFVPLSTQLLNNVQGSFELARNRQHDDSHYYSPATYATSAL